MCITPPCVCLHCVYTRLCVHSTMGLSVCLFLHVYVPSVCMSLLVYVPSVCKSHLVYVPPCTYPTAGALHRVYAPPYVRSIVCILYYVNCTLHRVYIPSVCMSRRGYVPSVCISRRVCPLRMCVSLCLCLHGV